MIIVKLIGGMGNQMFQYALGRRLAIENKTELKLDVSGYEHQEGITPRAYGLGVFSVDGQIASEEEVAGIKYPNVLFAKLGLSGKGYLRERMANIFDERILHAGNDHYLEGYWQTEQYFKEIRDVLLKEFSLRPEYDHLDPSVLRAMADGESVALHVRRGDYVSNPETNKYHGTCSPEYYHSAIRFIADKVGTPTFFVVSDDIAWVKENIKIDFPVTYVSNGILKDYEELILMSKCKHNIIANSSFSWWGAWLNQNPDKIVIAPKQWFNDPSAAKNDIVPDSWVRM